ncbi:hypothetical protein FYK55_07345 [Roseiconus nitratireducens]|uniref:Uncharacterized protein n=1 Tax=Roseiconus nitratireducens TaxID=2605748 RepID=A0A5M6DGC0_9BACT|nr:hypothetical protein [Roseiconus nitratireducens]KAA5545456.1 hypothetical protein FYK55_07345 [Roseiconus nitratireducens]
MMQIPRSGERGYLKESDPMMEKQKISLVCCQDTPQGYTQIVDIELDESQIQELTVETIKQTLDAGVQRGLHNAAPHPDHGPVTYFQTVHSGGFFVSVGPPDDLIETYFGAGSLVAFSDASGPGHGSRVGPEGVRRTLRILKGLLRPM